MGGIPMYTRLVEKFSGMLNGFLKMAQDLAAILDNEVAQLKEGKNEWSGPLKQRLQAFNLLCAIFTKTGADVPDLEKGLWMANLPRIYDQEEHAIKKAKALEIHRKICNNLKGKKTDAAKKVRALAETLVFFPDCGGYSGISMDNIIAGINLLFDELGLKPFRPNYAEITIPDPIHPAGPARHTRVVVVDDSADELLNSALALAGIPNLEVVMYRYSNRDAWRKLIGKELQAKLESTAGKVLELKPDIVLMDEGLSDIEGSQLVPAIKRALNGNFSVIFVANTGGTDEKLANVGCLGNFDKGHKPRGMVRAIDMIR